MLKKLEKRGQVVASNRAIELANPILNWFPENGHFLDFGCGIGHLGYYIAEQTNQKLVSLDVRAYPMSHPGINLEIFDGKTIPYPDNTFDTSFVGYTLHHTWKPESILNELRRVSKGRIIVSEDLLKTRVHIPIEVAKDILANCFYAHITMQYKTVDEWEHIFKKLDLKIEDRIFHSSGSLLYFEHVSWLLTKPVNDPAST